MGRSKNQPPKYLYDPNVYTAKEIEVLSSVNQTKRTIKIFKIWKFQIKISKIK